MDYELDKSSVFHLVVVTAKSENSIKLLDNLFGWAYKNKIANFNVLIQSNSIWSLVTYMPFKKDCQTHSHHIIATFTLNNVTKSLDIPFNELYPTKMQNLGGCKLRIAVIIFEPWVILNQVNNRLKFDGVDVKIIEEIAKKMNFTPEYILPKDGMERGVIFENGTATGAMGMVNK